MTRPGHHQLDEHHYADLSLATLQARISASFQDFSVFDTTVAENITWGDLTSADDPDRLQEAMTRSRVTGFLSRLPASAQTTVSNVIPHSQARRRPRLSGGQLQRLSIGRALYRREPDLLVLDQPASGLDPLAEQELMTDLLSHPPAVLTVLVTHRLRPLPRADLILVMHHGALVESGTHRQLLARAGRYQVLLHLSNTFG